MEFINYINKQVDIPEELILKLDSLFSKEELPKGTQLFLQNSHCKKVFFFEKGFGRVYYIKDGKDITHYFFTEDSFSAPIESVFYDQPSHCGMELLEKSIVRTAIYSELEKLIGESAPISKAIQMILIDVLRIFSDRLYTIQFQTAQERYTIMLENYPNIFLRAPLGHIASYLGITQETLSRIRSGK
jgi:CRP-like cAMP-binding protein